MKTVYLIHRFYPHYYTGTEKFVLILAMMTQKSGHKVNVVTYSFYKDSFYDRHIGNIILREFTYKGIPVLGLRHKKIPPSMAHALEDKELAPVAKDLISREGPDTVHVGHAMNVGELAKVLDPLGILSS